MYIVRRMIDEPVVALWIHDLGHLKLLEADRKLSFNNRIQRKTMADLPDIKQQEIT